MVAVIMIMPTVFILSSLFPQKAVVVTVSIKVHRGSGSIECIKPCAVACHEDEKVYDGNVVAKAQSTSTTQQAGVKPKFWGFLFLKNLLYTSLHSVVTTHGIVTAQELFLFRVSWFYSRAVWGMLYCVCVTSDALQVSNHDRVLLFTRYEISWEWGSK